MLGRGKASEAEGSPVRAASVKRRKTLRKGLRRSFLADVVGVRSVVPAALRLSSLELLEEQCFRRRSLVDLPALSLPLLVVLRPLV